MVFLVDLLMFNYKDRVYPDKATGSNRALPRVGKWGRGWVNGIDGALHN